ncbi:tRNA pseudouridine(38-40) synthase TruA [Prosthecochloris sp. ZM]|uniref:tRNA pseudouridine(38-40) synthase TruA n=2 Tax=unclassified Prosthecochloris TaxID=2632826 RepID=UPI0032657597
MRIRNLKMIIEYDGTDFAGWQRQDGAVSTVQGEIEAVLRRILQEAVSITGAGRTDKGVHAMGQVASFMTGSSMEAGRLCHSLNSLLPSSIRIMSLIDVDGDFHARYSALSRQYRYMLRQRESAIFRRFSGYDRAPHDLDQLNSRASVLLGRHDFKAFSKSGSDTRTTCCTVSEAQWFREKEYLVFQISANRFLRSMVRYLVSATLRFSGAEISYALVSRQPIKGLLPADPAGLFLWEIGYASAG